MAYLGSVFYQGSKNFWKTKKNVDIWIIDHVELACFEIIAYEPNLDVEAARIYLNSDLVFTKIKRGELEERLAFEKEQLIRQRKTVDAVEIAANITHDMIVQYILSRLHIPEKDDGVFSVVMRPSCIADKRNDLTLLLDVIIPKPDKVLPFKPKHTRNITSDEFYAKLKQFNNEINQVSSLNKVAAEYNRDVIVAVKNSAYNLSEESRNKLNRAVNKMGVVNTMRATNVVSTPVRRGLIRDGSVDDNHILENTGGFMSSTQSRNNKMITKSPAKSSTVDKKLESLGPVDKKLENVEENSEFVTVTVVNAVRRKVDRGKSIKGLINGENINSLPKINLKPLPQTKYVPLMKPVHKTDNNTNINNTNNNNSTKHNTTSLPDVRNIAAKVDSNKNSNNNNNSNNGGRPAMLSRAVMQSKLLDLRKYSIAKVDYSASDSDESDTEFSTKPEKHSDSFDYDHTEDENNDHATAGDFTAGDNSSIKVNISSKRNNSFLCATTTATITTTTDNSNNFDDKHDDYNNNNYHSSKRNNSFICSTTTATTEFDNHGGSDNNNNNYYSSTKVNISSKRNNSFLCSTATATDNITTTIDNNIGFDKHDFDFTAGGNYYSSTKVNISSKRNNSFLCATTTDNNIDFNKLNFDVITDKLNNTNNKNNNSNNNKNNINNNSNNNNHTNDNNNNILYSNIGCKTTDLYHTSNDNLPALALKEYKKNPKSLAKYASKINLFDQTHDSHIPGLRILSKVNSIRKSDPEVRSLDDTDEVTPRFLSPAVHQSSGKFGSTGGRGKSAGPNRSRLAPLPVLKVPVIGTTGKPAPIITTTTGKGSALYTIMSSDECDSTSNSVSNSNSVTPTNMYSRRISPLYNREAHIK